MIVVSVCAWTRPGSSGPGQISFIPEPIAVTGAFKLLFQNGENVSPTRLLLT